MTIKLEAGKTYHNTYNYEVTCLGTNPINPEELCWISEEGYMYRTDLDGDSDAKGESIKWECDKNPPMQASITLYYVRNRFTKEKYIRTSHQCNCWEVLGIKRVTVKEGDKV